MRKWHKWLGLFFAFFILMFSISGILLNHRKAISSIDIPRSILSKEYHYTNWNNEAVTGTIQLSPDSVLMYGGSGVWLTDTLGTYFSPFVNGMRKGADNRLTNSIVRTTSNEIFAVSTFGLYRLDKTNMRWQDLTERVESHDRFNDLIVKGDSMILLSRSNLFVALPPYERFKKITLAAPEGHKREASLFRTLWVLHSGELFGITGKLFVDLLGVVIILLTVTGVLLTIFPGIVVRRKKKKLPVKAHTNAFNTVLKWHNKPGVWLFAFLLIMTISGTFLRPPLLIAIVRAKVKTIPGTMLHKPNVWNDKLRVLRYDTFENDWILYTSDGFYNLKELDSMPVKMEKTPLISIMGVSVMEQVNNTNWIVGSFSGLYYWNRPSGESVNAYTMKRAEPRRPGPPVITDAVSGYSSDFGRRPVIFDYSKGARVLRSDKPFIPMPEIIRKEGRMSLWHLSLEVHTGRIYQPILGSILVELFIFLSGVISVIVLITGYIVYRRRHKKRKRE